jgi:outer membrane protein OmpA-like peptidoglycan-associated protein
MNSNPTVNLWVVGHIDNVEDDASKLSLAARRAASVVNELTGFHKIDKSRLSAEGKGEAQPIAENATKEGKAKNRGVEFIKLN